MNLIKISSLAFITVLTVAACHSSKKSTTSSSTASSAPAPAPATTSTVAAGPVAPAKSSNGVYAPGNEELTAALTKYPDVTLPVLAEGYAVYTGEACTACHTPKGIYRKPLERWPAIIDDMAHKASLTASQKDALTKYVFSIKATQPPPAAK
jgi:hypothetical protein